MYSVFVNKNLINYHQAFGAFNFLGQHEGKYGNYYALIGSELSYLLGGNSGNAAVYQNENSNHQIASTKIGERNITLYLSQAQFGGQWLKDQIQFTLGMGQYRYKYSAYYLPMRMNSNFFNYNFIKWFGPAFSFTPESNLFDIGIAFGFNLKESSSSKFEVLDYYINTEAKAKLNDKFGIEGALEFYIGDPIPGRSAGASVAYLIAAKLFYSDFFNITIAQDLDYVDRTERYIDHSQLTLGVGFDFTSYILGLQNTRLELNFPFNQIKEASIYFDIQFGIEVLYSKLFFQQEFDSSQGTDYGIVFGVQLN